MEAFLLECVENTENHRELIAVYNELGGLYRGTSRFTQSLNAFQKAKKLCAEELGENDAEYATILNNMAGTYRLTKDYNQAIEAFQKAADIYRQTGNESVYAYASVLNNLSLVYREVNQIDRAIAYLEQALALIETMPEYRQEAAITYNNLTELYCAVGDRNKAMLCLNRALQEYEKCPEEERAHYAAVLNSLAGFLYAEGDYHRALALYHQSAKYTKRFFGENMEYGITCQNMRWAYEQLGDREGAVAALTRAERVYEKLLGAEHERTRSVSDELTRMRRVSGT